MIAAIRRVGLVWPAIATLAALFILVQLGNWQMRRLAWKESLVEMIELRAQAGPVDLPPPQDWARLAREDYEYVRVAVTGRFNHAREMHAYTVISEPQGGPYTGPGYWVMTPLALEGGGTVLVNRGFVPLDRKDPSTRTEGQIEGVVEVEGLLRGPDEVSYFTPEPDLAQNQWFARVPAAMAAAAGLGEAAPFFIDAGADQSRGGLPQGGETRLALPNRHLEYAVTWYGLAASLLAVFVAFSVSRLRRPGGG